MTDVAEPIIRKSTPGHGGHRPGAGRKPKTDQADAYTVLAKAKAKRETHLAQIAELDYKQRLGELVPAADVREAWAGHITQAKVALLALPSKCAHELAGVSDPVVISQILRARVNEILMDLAGNESAS
jgi:hypothetical protein